MTRHDDSSLRTTRRSRRRRTQLALAAACGLGLAASLAGTAWSQGSHAPGVSPPAHRGAALVGNEAAPLAEAAGIAAPAPQPTTLTHVMTRTTAGGITIRVYESGTVATGTGTPPAPPPTPPPPTTPTPAPTSPTTTPGLPQGKSPACPCPGCGCQGDCAAVACPIVTPATGTSGSSRASVPAANQSSLSAGKNGSRPSLTPCWQAPGAYRTPEAVCLAPGDDPPGFGSNGSPGTSADPVVATPTDPVVATPTDPVVGGSLVIELSDAAAVASVTVPLPASPTDADAVAVVANGVFGVAEDAPASWLVVAAGSSITDVAASGPTAAVGSTGQADDMAPIDGIAVLATPGQLDGWTVTGRAAGCVVTVPATTTPTGTSIPTGTPSSGATTTPAGGSSLPSSAGGPTTQGVSAASADGSCVAPGSDSGSAPGSQVTTHPPSLVSPVTPIEATPSTTHPSATAIAASAPKR